MNTVRDLTGIIPAKSNLCISLTGGGGKTTLMQTMARFYCNAGKTVLITTTTKIGDADHCDWDADFIFTNANDVIAFKSTKPCVVLYADKTDISGKLVCPGFDILEELNRRFDVLLCEADGSRHMPLKIHTDRDPVILPFNDFTVCVIGGWCLGKNAAAYTFGPLPADRTVVDYEFVDWYMNNPEGLFKRTEKNKRCIWLSGSDYISREWKDFFRNKSEKVLFG